jgi:GNAT superfamily N-acetyltransferase
MYVTRHNSAVDRTLVDRLWCLYESAYQRTAEAAASREMFFRSEFESHLADPTNRLWVLWADDEPVGMVLIATDIASTRYLSAPFFERHFAGHSRRGAVHYILFVVVDPRFAAKGVLTRMARDVLGTEAAEGVLLVFDAPEYNQPQDEGGVALMMERLAKMVAGGAPLLPLDVSRYYGIDFAASPAYTEHVDEVAIAEHVEQAEPSTPAHPAGARR